MYESINHVEMLREETKDVVQVKHQYHKNPIHQK